MTKPHVFRTATAIGALALGLSSVLTGAGAGAGAAGAAAPSQGKVGPNQVFAATVNGGSGIVTPAVIRVVCFGPIVPGQLGHPMSHQSVEVFRPEVIVASLGFTGPTATSIQAFFGAPPPAPASVGEGSNVVFTRYGVSKAIPTSILVPCSGTGHVYFVPLPMTPIGPGRIASVRVSYVGQP